MTFTQKLNESQIEKIKERLNNYIVTNTNMYSLYTFKHLNNIITIYTTKKLLIQGKEISNTLNLINDILEIEEVKAQKTEKVNYTINAIGSDEVGTGDFFGPVVVCSCYVSKDIENELLSLGIRDSKEITDEKIKSLAPIIMEKTLYSYRVLDNLTYNKLNYNLNEIKAILHNFVMNNLSKRVISQALSLDLMIIDGFCTQTKYFEYLRKQETVVRNVKLIPKAENLYTSVACASIIARYLFLMEMEKLSNNVGFSLPKGASQTVDLVCAKIIEEKGLKILPSICKLNFKNFEKAKSYLSL